MKMAQSNKSMYDAFWNAKFKGCPISVPVHEPSNDILVAKELHFNWGKNFSTGIFYVEWDDSKVEDEKDLIKFKFNG